MTIEAYIKCEGGQPQERSILVAYGLPQGYSFSIRTERYLFATTYGIKDFGEATDAIIPDDGGWHHGAVVHDSAAGEMRFYVDGELKTTVAYTGGIIVTEYQRLYLGIEASYDNTASINPYLGSLDRVRIYNEVLGPDQFDMVENRFLRWGMGCITKRESISYPTG